MRPKYLAEILLETVIVLNEAAHHLEQQFDVDDGADGTPSPNWAMRLHAQVEECIRACDASIESINNQPAGEPHVRGE